MSKRIVCFVAALLTGSAVPAFAQLPGAEISVFGGVFAPLTDVIDQEEVNLTVKQKEGLAVGGRLGIELPGPLGVEGTFMYAFSDVESSAEGDVVDVDASVWMASARLVYGLLALPAAPVSLNVNGGVALIGHGGDAYEGASGTTDVGGVLGLTLRIDPPGLVSLRVDVEDYLYSAAFEGAEGDQSESKFQSDLVVSAGLVFRLGL